MLRRSRPPSDPGARSCCLEVSPRANTSTRCCPCSGRGWFFRRNSSVTATWPVEGCCCNVPPAAWSSAISRCQTPAALVCAEKKRVSPKTRALKHRPKLAADSPVGRQLQVAPRQLEHAVGKSLRCLWNRVRHQPEGQRLNGLSQIP